MELLHTDIAGTEITLWSRSDKNQPHAAQCTAALLLLSVATMADGSTSSKVSGSIALLAAHARFYEVKPYLAATRKVHARLLLPTAIL
jgi:hypothetical protein